MTSENNTTNQVSIPLSRGKEALVDIQDNDLTLFKWYLTGVSKKGIRYIDYARRTIKQDGTQQTIYLHRAVIERVIGRPLHKGEVVDHIDGNSMNNSRSNLRVVTHQHNVFNSKGRHDSKSGYKGVSWNKKTKRWRAGIRLNGKQIHLGYFDDPALAHEAYKEAAAIYYDGFYTPR